MLRSGEPKSEATLHSEELVFGSEQESKFDGGIREGYKQVNMEEQCCKEYCKEYVVKRISIWNYECWRIFQGKTQKSEHRKTNEVVLIHGITLA